MGWKRLKAHFGIEHIVTMEGDDVRIGSAYILDLMRISGGTGAIVVDDDHRSFLCRAYPELMDAAPAELLALIGEPDHFLRSIPVFTFEQGVVVERFCEAIGFPNVTHDGHVMHNNTYFSDRAAAYEHGRRDLENHIEWALARIDESRKALHLEEQELQVLHDQLSALKANQPPL